jgi:hypothetical protein
MVFNLSAIESGGALNAERPHSARPDGLGDELVLPRFRYGLQAMGDGECSIAQRAFRNHARDFCLFARQGTALQIRV